MNNIHEHMSEKMQLAGIYAQDGAFLTAADRLRSLANDLEKHHVDCETHPSGAPVNHDKVAKAISYCLHGTMDDLENILNDQTYESSTIKNGAFVLTGENGVSLKIVVQQLTAPNHF